MQVTETAHNRTANLRLKVFVYTHEEEQKKEKEKEKEKEKNSSYSLNLQNRWFLIVQGNKLMRRQHQDV